MPWILFLSIVPRATAVSCAESYSQCVVLRDLGVPRATPGLLCRGLLLPIGCAESYPGLRCRAATATECSESHPPVCYSCYARPAADYEVNSVPATPLPPPNRNL